MAKTALQSLLYQQFSETDARLLDYFFSCLGASTYFSYTDIDLTVEERKDLIFLGYEERLILPVKTKAGPAWEDRILDFDLKSFYTVTPVTQQIPMVMKEKALFSREAILTEFFSEFGPVRIKTIYQLLDDIMVNSRGFMFEAGLLKLYHEKLDIGLDLHDTLDLFVIYGIMSPCPQKSLITGLSWYEISPAMFWGRAFGQSCR
ncbi:MAG: hypothetical protein KAH09_01795 [Desulfobacula sp.]|nr:hypothetical protein [Desulfobacula sp.]